MNGYFATASGTPRVTLEQGRHVGYTCASREQVGACLTGNGGQPWHAGGQRRFACPARVVIPARGLPDPANAHEALAGLVDVLADRQATRLSTGFRLTADNRGVKGRLNDTVVPGNDRARRGEG